MRIRTRASRHALPTLFALVAAASITMLAPAPALAQRIDFAQPLQFNADAGLDLGSSDTRTAQRAVLAVGDDTWVTGRRDDPGEDDVYVARFGPGGQQALLRRYDLGADDTGIALAPAAGGGVYVAAISRGRSGGPPRVFVLRIASDGALALRHELANAGTWTSLGLELLLSTDGAGGLITGLNAVEPGGTPAIVLTRLQDQGASASRAWQSILRPTAEGYDQLGVAWAPAADRVAVSMQVRINSSNERPFTALLGAADGGLIASTVADVNAQRVLPVAFISDGSLSVVVREAFSNIVRLLRYTSNGFPFGSTTLTCSTQDCEIDAMTVTSDGATWVIGTDFTEDAAVLLRFAPPGMLNFTRRYAFGARSSGRGVAAVGTAVDIGLNARLDPGDISSTRWLVGRVDASGTPADASGFLVASSRSANLVTMQRAANGVLSLAGAESIDFGRVVVAQMVTSEPSARFVASPAPSPTGAEFPSHGRALLLDALGQPVVVFNARGNDFRGVGVRAFTAAGTPRWSFDSSPLLREASPSATLDPSGRLSLVSAVGNFPAGQLAVRQFGADGSLLQGPNFNNEAGVGPPLVAAAADGTRVLAARLGQTSIVVRMIEADGQPRWRRVITPGGQFPSVAGVFRLPDGDAVVMYAPDTSVGGSVVTQRLARFDGAPAAPVTVATDGPGFTQQVKQDGSRLLAAIVDNTQVRFACFDLIANAVCFNQAGPAGDAASFADMDFDLSQNTLYAGMTTLGGTPTPRLLALNATTGAVLADATLGARPVRAVRGVFVRGGNPVLVADRQPDGGPESQGLEMFTLSPQGQLLAQASLNAGQRLELDQLRYDAVADRAYLLGTRTPIDGAAEPSLLGVAFDRPAQVFADGFE